MAAKRPPNRSGVFLGGVGGTIGKGGAGPDPAEVRQQFAKRREEAAKNRFKALKKEPSGFFERVAEDIGLEDFYERDVIPVMGKVFADTFKNAKETYGLSLVTPVALGARGVAAAVDKDEEFDEGFDYAADAVRAGAGVIKTQGWEPAKKFVAPAVDKGTKIAKQGVDAFKDAVEKTDDYVEKEAPQYAIVKGWADRHAVEPAKDAVVEVISKVTDQPVNQRIDEADDMDRNFLYLSNDITQRGKERESAATPQQRERWMRMALGEYESPAWRGYKSPFSREQLAVMSDYELVNAAYGTHTNSIASFFEAAKNDLKKIAAMPAALNVLSEQITEADKRGDYRGLGNTAEFLARQIAGVFIAVNQATLYAATGGKLGDAEPLVRALKTEPILTSLDVAATASLYGKGATAALKTGGALSKAGAVAARVPGAPQVGGAIARVAERGAATTRRVPRPVRGFADLTPEEKKAWYEADNAWLEEAHENFLRRREEIKNSPEQAAAEARVQEALEAGTPPSEIPKTPLDIYDAAKQGDKAFEYAADGDGIRPRPTFQEFAFDEINQSIPVVGPVLRGAARLGRGARGIADIERVEVRDPALRAISDVGGVEVGADRVFRPSSSFFSKSASLLRKKIYEGENPISRAIYRRGEKADARAQRAVISAVVEQLGSERAAPIVAAFTEIYKESPDLALRALWDLQGPRSFTMPEGFGGETVRLTPGAYADQLEDVLAGRLWLRRGDDPEADKNDVFRFSDESPGEGWQRVIPDDQKAAPGAPVIKLTEIETANLRTQIGVLRNLDDLPEEAVVRAREVLESPYREVFGDRIGRRIGGREAPSGSLESLLSADELEDIRALTGLGVDIDPRIADLPVGVTERLRGQLGIGAPTGITRRAEGLAGVARLQDLTIARLMPLVPDETRAEVERIINKAVSEKATEISYAQTALANMERSVLRGVEAEEQVAFLEEALRQLEAYAQNKIEGLPPISEERRLEILEATGEAWKKIKERGGPVAQPGGVQGIVDIPEYEFKPLAVSPDVVFGEKVGEPTGSNVSGVSGRWRGSDGVERYVKEYDNEGQAFSELIANEIYRRLGINVPTSRISISPDGSVVIVNDIVEGVPFNKWIEEVYDGVTGKDQDVAREVLKGIVADAWLANWDTVGLNLDNIIVTKDFKVYRIDQGGALIHRAQGEQKSRADLEKADLEDFWNNNPAYRRVIQRAGYGSVSEIPSLGRQIEQIEKLIKDAGGVDGLLVQTRNAFVDEVDELVEGTDSFSTANAADLLKVSNDGVDFLADNEINRVLVDRIKELRKQLATTPVETNPIAALVQRGPLAIREYQGAGHRPINTFLRGIGYDEMPLSEYNGLFVADDIADQIMQYVSVLDQLFDALPTTTEDMVVFRGMSGLPKQFVDQFLEEDYVFIDDGFVSTSFRQESAEAFTSEGGGSMMFEILVPEGSKGFYGDGVALGNYSSEREFILPRGTAFKIIDTQRKSDGSLAVRAIALTPDNPQIREEFPEFDNLISEIRALEAENIREDIDVAREDIERAAEAREAMPAQERALKEAQADYQTLLNAQKNIDFVLESLMRDALEASDTPMGATVFMPTLGGAKSAKKTVLPKEALAGRGRPRDLKDIYTGQFALLGSMQDLEQFSGALARNMRIPFVAYEAVTRFTDYLMRTGTTIRFSDDAAEFENQIDRLSEAGLINGNGELGDDYVILPVNNKTSFFDEGTFQKLSFEETEAVGTTGRSDVGVDDAQTALIIDEALAKNAIENLESIPKGSTVVVISRARYDTLRKEMQAAAQAPGRLRRLTRLWVRITLTTLPRTPIANVVGSGMLSALGGGLGGYREALRLMRFSNAPPELLNKGLAGQFDEGGDLVVSPQRKRFRLAQRYMNYMYYYNVMGEDLARLSVFAQAAKKGIKDAKLVKQMEDELLEATELNDAFQTLLEAVARGEFANGKPLTPELIRIRDDALQKADDFLGGARGLTSQQRMITTFIPFWQWYKHIFKLYFYTLPFKYPGRSLTLNAMARYGAEESARQGYYDSFYEDGIKIGEDVRGPNIYSKALSTNIFPFTFAGVLEAQEGAPGASFLASNVAPVITTPLRVAGFGVPGQPLLTPKGEELRGDFLSGERGEVALSELERLIAPVGLLQRYLTPRGSLLLGAGRLATGRDIPQAEPRGEGLAYDVTPRGFAGLGMQALPELAARAFGATIERVPVEGPVARRRLKDLEERERQRVLERYKEQRREQRENR